MTIKYKPVVNDQYKLPYFCVKYGSATIVFKNETEAFAAFKALGPAIGATSYYTYHSNTCDSYSIYDVVRFQEISLERKLFVLEDQCNWESKNCVVDEIPIVKCDESSCWRSEDLMDNGDLPCDWQEVDGKHYCKEHSK